MKRILVIEDNYEILENTLELLELEGFIVFSANNGIDGIALANKEMPDVILCDIMMPGIDGYEVLRSLKDNPVTRKIPFIFLTASVERKDVQTGFEMGAQGYIRKPFEMEELYKTIASCTS